VPFPLLLAEMLSAFDDEVPSVLPPPPITGDDDPAAALLW
jgi:hypothetical protein